MKRLTILALLFLMYGGAMAQVTQGVLQQTEKREGQEEEYKVVAVDTFTTIDGVSILEELLSDTVPAPQQRQVKAEVRRVSGPLG